MMNIEDLRAYCLSFKGVHEKMPFGKSTSDYDRGLLVFYVLDKWFCFVNVDVFDFCDLKCPTEQIDELQAQYEGIRPGYHMNKRHWISVCFNRDVPDDKIRELVRQSYETVVSELPKKEREMLQNDAPQAAPAEEPVPVYELEYTPEQRRLAEHLIGLERAALDKWFQGDTSGYEQLWSRRSFSYFDGVVTHRVDDHATIAAFLKTIDGKLFARSYDFRAPRVQFGEDMAVLTYQLFADTSLLDMKYNCIEIFQKESDGQWRVIHSTWSFYRPMEMNFGSAKEIV